MTLQEIRARKAQQVAAMRALLNKATTEKRALSADEASQCDAMKAAITDLKAQESRVAFLDEQKRLASGVVSTGTGDTYAQDQSQVSLLLVLPPGGEGHALPGVGAEE